MDPGWYTIEFVQTRLFKIAMPQSVESYIGKKGERLKIQVMQDTGDKIVAYFKGTAIIPKEFFKYSGGPKRDWRGVLK